MPVVKHFRWDSLNELSGGRDKSGPYNLLTLFLGVLPIRDGTGYGGL